MASLLIIEDNLELANLLSAVAELRGHRARVAHSGAEALAALGQGRFDAAVTDLFLPDVGGGELLDRLKAAGVPAWAMSGVYQSDKWAKEAIDLHGARGFFTKPFPILGLMKSIEKSLGIEAEIEANAQPTVLGAAVPVPEPVADAPAAKVQPLDAWERVWSRGVAAPVGPRPQLERSGSLGVTSVPRLLNAAFQARMTGELVLRRGPALKVMTLENGQPIYAASNLAHERFARFAARKGLLPAADLDAVASLAKEEKLKTGDAMIRLGLLDETQRRRLLEEQVKEIIWSTFSWSDGDYGFALDRKSRPDVVTISVFPGELILEGCLREPLIELRTRLRGTALLFPAADPPYQLEQLTFSGEQASLIAHADGSKAVDDLLALTDLTEREGLGLLWGLKQAGLLEEREPTTVRRRRETFGL